MVTPSVAPQLVTAVPLFSGFTEEQAQHLLTVFEKETFEPQQVVFEAGSVPSHLRVLTEGSLSVRGEQGEVFEVHPYAPVGELSAMTGQVRKLTVIATERSTILSVSTAALETFLRENGDIAFVFHQNLLRVAGRKIARDRRRLGEMSNNIINTQKAMKRMRDALLESEDNPLHAALFEELDALIEQNRKIRYLVEPSRLIPTAVQLPEGRARLVKAISTEWLYFEGPAPTVGPGQDISLTLILDGEELVISGKVERSNDTEVVLYLDELIPEFEDKLNRHLARAQLLDVVL